MFKRNWEVHYIVGRDNSATGDYFYESVINPEGVIVHRFIVPLTRIDGLFNNVIWKALWFRIRNIILVCKPCSSKRLDLFEKKTFRLFMATKFQGVLAVRLLRFFRIKDECQNCYPISRRAVR